MPAPVDLQTIEVNLHAMVKEAFRAWDPRLQSVNHVTIPLPVTWAQRLLRLLERHEDSYIRTVRTHDDLHDLLIRLWEYMDDHADVNDGAEGHPVPNRALSFTQEIDSAIEFVLREKRR